MSILSDFANEQFQTAKSIIGTTDFSIGSGQSVGVVSAESRFDRGHELNGFQKSSSLELVILLSDFVTAYPDEIGSYLGKHCTHKSDPWKIGDIRAGESFVMISLVDRTEVS